MTANLRRPVDSRKTADPVVVPQPPAWLIECVPAPLLDPARPGRTRDLEAWLDAHGFPRVGLIDVEAARAVLGYRRLTLAPEVDAA
ncbi:hypothetical protein GCM10009737_28260 [Nocardioides lentus]|uniref:Uncharacterized protein n=1 Tax=Nocardioides lentus TaxID=338077 RepID=A0ABN2PLE0_9ACTN